MKHLAQAIVYAAAFLKLSADDVVDPDSSVKAMEDIVFAPGSCTPEETQAVSEAALHAASATRSVEEREFFEQFVETFHVGGEGNSEQGTKLQLGTSGGG